MQRSVSFLWFSFNDNNGHKFVITVQYWNLKHYNKLTLTNAHSSKDYLQCFGWNLQFFDKNQLGLQYILIKFIILTFLHRYCIMLHKFCVRTSRDFFFTICPLGYIIDRHKKITFNEEVCSLIKLFIIWQ